ncbi:MAG: DUF547 domain-containing protein [Pseudomonadota bacterium]
MLSSAATISKAEDDALYAPFETLLASSVVDGNVDYPAFAVSNAFASLVTDLETARPPADSQAARLAFYINAYNVMAIQGILDGYSPSSIWSRLRFFKRRKYDLFGTSMSLYELEHERIIAEGDPRIHFAIVCASKSCPPLRSALYTAADLDAELDDVTRRFINTPGSNDFDAQINVATVSRIFKWYRDEFKDEAGSLQRYLASYVEDASLRESLMTEDWSIEFHDYDWSLNGTPLPR